MNILEILKTKIRGEPALSFPFTYSGGYIWDGENHMVLMMRGWGYIQYAGDNATEIQDSIGEWVVEVLNREGKNL